MASAASARAWAEVNGARLYYEERGAGPCLLLLHGFALDRRMWAPQLEGLSDRFRVVAYDTRGFGRSSMPGRHPFKHCEDAAALIEHLGLAPVVAVGHSIGGHHLLELALTRPDLVRGFAAICLSGLAGTPFPDEITATFAAIKRAVRAEGVPAAKRAWAACGWFDSTRDDPALAGALDAMLADYSGWHWQNDNPVENIDPPAAARLGELRVPALVVTGGRDIPYNATVAARLLSGIPGAAALHLPEVGHMANMEAPEAVNRALAELAGPR